MIRPDEDGEIKNCEGFDGCVKLHTPPDDIEQQRLDNENPAFTGLCVACDYAVIVDD